MAGAGKTLWPSPEAGHKTLMRGALPIPQGKEYPYLPPKDEGHGEEFEQTDLAKFPSVYYP